MLSIVGSLYLKLIYEGQLPLDLCLNDLSNGWFSEADAITAILCPGLNRFKTEVGWKLSLVSDKLDIVLVFSL